MGVRTKNCQSRDNLKCICMSAISTIKRFHSTPRMCTISPITPLYSHSPSLLSPSPNVSDISTLRMSEFTHHREPAFDFRRECVTGKSHVTGNCPRARRTDFRVSFFSHSLGVILLAGFSWSCLGILLEWSPESRSCE